MNTATPSTQSAHLIQHVHHDGTQCTQAGERCSASSLLTESAFGRLWPVALLLAFMWLVSFWVLGWL